MVDINIEIKRLVQYALTKELIKEEDKIYSINLLLEALNLDDYEDMDINNEQLNSIENILDNILNWAYENKVLEHNTPVYRDLLDTKIMNCFMPRPSELIGKFNKLYNEDPKKAMDYYYDISKNSNYIRTERVAKDMLWKAQTEYGDLDITINLSKPEKDPKAIAEAKNMKSTSYPKCLLCKENEGYAGRINHPARQSHRIVPLTLKEEKWFLQYSPYVYYNEHCIILKAEHEPMKISKDTFDRLLEFVEKFPHYFIGSNADLPIVGGSILSHDHFQGGNYEFAMAKAPIEQSFKLIKYPNIEVSIVKWPMSVIRLKGKNREEISELAEVIFNKWKNYSDEEVEVIAYSNDTSHNTVTPIARKREDLFEIDLVLRNNRTSNEHPLGIFHPHDEVHHIKKENIGLIEVMGLAVLPPRLKYELQEISKYLLNEELDIKKEEELEKHLEWFNYLKNKYSDIHEANIYEILKKEIGNKFRTVLEHAGVFKCDRKGRKAFVKFLKEIND